MEYSFLDISSRKSVGLIIFVHSGQWNNPTSVRFFGKSENIGLLRFGPMSSLLGHLILYSGFWKWKQREDIIILL
jgi:hypothetical protein